MKKITIVMLIIALTTIMFGCFEFYTLNPSGKIIYLDNAHLKCFSLRDKSTTTLSYNEFDELIVLGEYTKGDFCVVDNNKRLFLISDDKIVKSCELPIIPTTAIATEDYIYYNDETDLYIYDLKSCSVKQLDSNITTNLYNDLFLLNDSIYYVKDGSMYSLSIQSLEPKQICNATQICLINQYTQNIILKTKDKLYNYNVSTNKLTRAYKYGNINSSAIMIDTNRIICLYPSKIDLTGINLYIIDSHTGIRNRVLEYYDYEFGDKIVFVEF